ncbi:hypothetical protein TNCV_832821 [Trichonephila clavipes]|uniref:Uncharacterized protein n=1 Tax=Trichonephila clavipes TaxID=2585209 RepID=A0A8X6UYE6_TRICX|nr:hypothetical protein TNCV_832821 [Trichonephila clavipes]
MGSSPLAPCLKTGRGWMSTSYYSAARGLLVTDFVILNPGQVTRTTSELPTPSPNFPITLTVGRLSLDIFNVHRLPLHDRSAATLRSKL